MSRAEVLYQLQELDLQIEECARTLASIRSQLGESEELRRARADKEETRRQLHQAQAQLRESEWDLERVSGKLKEVAQKLYGGTVRAPKELASLEREAALLQRAKGAAEDGVLEKMIALESLQAQLGAKEKAYQQQEAAWRAEQHRLEQELRLLESKLRELTQARQSLSQTVDAGSLGLYEALRRDKKSRAVSRVEQNTCQSCRISLPMAQVHSARTSPNLVFCGSCGRILYASR